MTWMEFVVVTVGALAWPGCVIGVALIIRREMDKP